MMANRLKLNYMYFYYSAAKKFQWEKRYSIFCPNLLSFLAILFSFEFNFFNSIMLKQICSMLEDILFVQFLIRLILLCLLMFKILLRFLGTSSIKKSQYRRFFIFLISNLYLLRQPIFQRQYNLFHLSKWSNCLF